MKQRSGDTDLNTPVKFPLIFPTGFFWGAATAGHQVEGNNKNDWTEWETSPARREFLEKSGLAAKYGRENFISGRGTDFYNRFAADYKMAREELGHNAARFSIEWARIEPEEGRFDENEIAHYRTVVRTLRDLGMEPFVNLWHWPIPLWMRDKGGFESSESPRYFARYVEKVVTAFGGDVKFWLTLNEPEIYTTNSYLRGHWPPQKKSLFAYVRVLNHLIACHKAAYIVIKKIQPSAQVGLAKNNVFFEAGGGILDNVLVKKFADWWWNFHFLNRIRRYQDFISLNFYFHNRINYGFNKNDNERVSDMGWELYPHGIYHVLSDLKRYKKPMYVTENGLADASDTHRPWFIVEMLKNIHRAIRDGADVRGYMHWSLMDNFEWDKGYWPRFGLIEIDYATLERKPRPSAFLYSDIIRANGITEEILATHNQQIARSVSRREK